MYEYVNGPKDLITRYTQGLAVQIADLTKDKERHEQQVARISYEIEHAEMQAAMFADALKLLP